MKLAIEVELLRKWSIAQSLCLHIDETCRQHVAIKGELWPESAVSPQEPASLSSLMTWL